MTELAGLAPLAGAAFTGNVDVAGTLTQGGYNVLTTQYTPPVTDLPGYAQKIWSSLHRECDCWWYSDSGWV